MVLSSLVGDLESLYHVCVDMSTMQKWNCVTRSVTEVHKKTAPPGTEKLS